VTLPYQSRLDYACESILGAAYKRRMFDGEGCRYPNAWVVCCVCSWLGADAGVVCVGERVVLWEGVTKLPGRSLKRVDVSACLCPAGDMVLMLLT
jgi:hypothetical protein